VTLVADHGLAASRMRQKAESTARQPKTVGGAVTGKKAVMIRLLQLGIPNLT